VQTFQFSLFYMSPLSQITNCPQRAFTICTYTTSLTFDLSHGIRINSQEVGKKTFQGRKKSEEPFRRATEEDVINTFNEYDINHE